MAFIYADYTNSAKIVFLSIKDLDSIEYIRTSKLPVIKIDGRYFMMNHNHIEQVKAHFIKHGHIKYCEYRIWLHEVTNKNII